MYLVFNVGSSSLKLSVYAATGDGDPVLAANLEVAGLGTARTTARGSIDGARHDLTATFAGCREHRAGLAEVWRWLARGGVAAQNVRAAGHRVVHGGSAFSAPVLIDGDVRSILGTLAPLAPLHMPPCLSVIDAVRETLPAALHVACFDTAFHARMPEEARRLPLPETFDQQGYRRYGFHGLSYESAVSELTKALGHLPRRLIVLHLGNGASAAAILDGRSVATTMGYSAVDGLVMGTRTGAIDPGVLLGLMRDHGLGAGELERLLYHESGLLALSGETSDMRALLASTSARAAFAVDYYCYWAARHAGSLAVALGGLDAIAFTGGIGENAAVVRAQICSRLGFLGVTIDPEGNALNNFDLTRKFAGTGVYIVPAKEELVIARHAQRLADQAGSCHERPTLGVT